MTPDPGYTAASQAYKAARDKAYAEYNKALNDAYAHYIDTLNQLRKAQEAAQQ